MVAVVTTSTCFFVSDLHGQVERYDKLFQAVASERPAAVFVGGDLLAHRLTHDPEHFFTSFLGPRCHALKEQLGGAYPRIFVILGNDDGRLPERWLIEAGSQGLWEYVNERCVPWGDLRVYGYSYVPPTPFLLKDWERYDVSRYVDPGCVSPEQGHRTSAADAQEVRSATISSDLEHLLGAADASDSVWLFHTPPYRTSLDLLDQAGKLIDHVPLDEHVGSVAVRRFIEDHQPLVTLHGHIHESVRLSGSWHEQLGRTHAFSAAHDGSELALVRFDPHHPAGATRQLL